METPHPCADDGVHRPRPAAEAPCSSQAMQTWRLLFDEEDIPTLNSPDDFVAWVRKEQTSAELACWPSISQALRSSADDVASHKLRWVQSSADFNGAGTVLNSMSVNSSSTSPPAGSAGLFASDVSLTPASSVSFSESDVSFNTRRMCGRSQIIDHQTSSGTSAIGWCVAPCILVVCTDQQHLSSATACRCTLERLRAQEDQRRRERRHPSRDTSTPPSVPEMGAPVQEDQAFDGATSAQGFSALLNRRVSGTASCASPLSSSVSFSESDVSFNTRRMCGRSQIIDHQTSPGTSAIGWCVAPCILVVCKDQQHLSSATACRCTSERLRVQENQLRREGAPSSRGTSRAAPAPATVPILGSGGTPVVSEYRPVIPTHQRVAALAGITGLRAPRTFSS